MNEKEALLKMEGYCSSGEHCIYDVRKKLDSCELSAEQIESIIEKLKREKFIDEKRYAAAFVHDKLYFSKWGKLKISNMLRLKQIPHDVVSEALAGIDTEDYMTILKDVVNSKKRSIKGKTDYEKSIKLIKSVASRGFEIPLIKQLVNIEEEW